MENKTKSLYYHWVVVSTNKLFGEIHLDGIQELKVPITRKIEYRELYDLKETIGEEVKMLTGCSYTGHRFTSLTKLT